MMMCNRVQNGMPVWDHTGDNKVFSPSFDLRPAVHYSVNSHPQYKHPQLWNIQGK